MFIDSHCHSDRRLRSLTSRAPADQKNRKLHHRSTFLFIIIFFRFQNCSVSGTFFGESNFLLCKFRRDSNWKVANGVALVCKAAHEQWRETQCVVWLLVFQWTIPIVTTTRHHEILFCCNNRCNRCYWFCRRLESMKQTHLLILFQLVCCSFLRSFWFLCVLIAKESILVLSLHRLAVTVQHIKQLNTFEARS